MRRPGTVSLVGAGPGDPELLTVRALKRLARADAVVYDRLVSRAVLEFASPTALMVPVGKVPGRHTIRQEEISALLVDLARRYDRVVRLKGGDPFVFGRGGEEMEVLRDAGIVCEVVPGITAAQGAAATAGVPLTHRGIATGVRFVTGHCRGGLPLTLDWEGLADQQTTAVVYMGAASIGGIARRLIAVGAEPERPVLAIASATTPHERRVISTLSRVAADVAEARLSGPVLFIIGEVVTLCREKAAGEILTAADLESALVAGHA